MWVLLSLLLTSKVHSNLSFINFRKADKLLSTVVEEEGEVDERDAEDEDDGEVEVIVDEVAILNKSTRQGLRKLSFEIGS